MGRKARDGVPEPDFGGKREGAMVTMVQVLTFEIENRNLQSREVIQLSLDCFVSSLSLRDVSPLGSVSP